MATFLDTIHTYLTYYGVSDANWPVFIGFAQDAPDQCIVLTPSGGQPQDTLGMENVLGTFQVQVRAAQYEYDTCLEKWAEVFDTLQDADVTDVFLLSALASEPGVFYDSLNRPIASNDYRYTRKK